LLASRDFARDADHAAGGPIAVAAGSDARACARDLTPEVAPLALRRFRSAGSGCNSFMAPTAPTNRTWLSFVSSARDRRRR
jgi:hypothetical protein